MLSALPSLIFRANPAQGEILLPTSIADNPTLEKGEAQSIDGLFSDGRKLKPRNGWSKFSTTALKGKGLGADYFASGAGWIILATDNTTTTKGELWGGVLSGTSLAQLTHAAPHTSFSRTAKWRFSTMYDAGAATTYLVGGNGTDSPQKIWYGSSVMNYADVTFTDVDSSTFKPSIITASRGRFFADDPAKTGRINFTSINDIDGFNTSSGGVNNSIGGSIVGELDGGGSISDLIPVASGLLVIKQGTCYVVQTEDWDTGTATTISHAYSAFGAYNAGATGGFFSAVQTGSRPEDIFVFYKNQIYQLGNPIPISEPLREFFNSATDNVQLGYNQNKNEIYVACGHTDGATTYYVYIFSLAQGKWTGRMVADLAYFVNTNYFGSSPKPFLAMPQNDAAGFLWYDYGTTGGTIGYATEVKTAPTDFGDPFRDKSITSVKLYGYHGSGSGDVDVSYTFRQDDTSTGVTRAVGTDTKIPGNTLLNPYGDIFRECYFTITGTTSMKLEAVKVNFEYRGEPDLEHV